MTTEERLEKGVNFKNEGNEEFKKGEWKAAIKNY